MRVRWIAGEWIERLMEGGNAGGRVGGSSSDCEDAKMLADEYMEGRNGRMNKWNMWKSASMTAWMDGCIDGWKDGWVVYWMDGLIDEWVYGFMVGWTGERINE